MDAIVIFITCANRKEAKNISTALVKNRLAACVNIVDNIKSVFWWKGKVAQAKEVLLIIKSCASKMPKITRLVKSLHSYEVMEIIALPIVAGERKYLNWINESIR